MAVKHDWKRLDPMIERLMAEGWSEQAACKEVGIKRTTYRYHREASVPEPLDTTESVHHSTPENTTEQEHLRTPEYTMSAEGHLGTPEVHPELSADGSGVPQEHPGFPNSAHPSTPEPTELSPDEQYTQEHPGTLEEYREVIEEVHQSVPDTPHISIDEVPLSTPVVHPELSPDDSSTVHPSVPARQEPLLSTPMVHPGTLLEEDWELWTTIKARWLEVEKILAERQVTLSTPVRTPGHTQKKTYVFDVRHIGLIDRYAQDHRLDLKDVIYTMCQEFFERRGYVATE